MKFSVKSFVIGFGCAALSLGAVTYANAAGDATIKSCANKTTGVMRYITKGGCKKTEILLSWSEAGPQGDTGLKGDTGTKGDTGLKGDTGIKGDTGLKGDTGTKGDTGLKGDKGDTGLKGDTGADGASSPVGFTARSVCGANGMALCAVGVQGPGGGTIVYVDSTSEMVEYDYLEVSPTDASPGVAWSTPTPWCGADARSSCQTSWIRDISTFLDFWILGTGRSATAGIAVRHGSGGVSLENYAAGVAIAYSTPTASDWFLPSIYELNEVCKYAANTNQAPGVETFCSGGITRSGFTQDGYWSSSENGAPFAVYQAFSSGGRGATSKASTFAVRPVRAF